MKKIKELLRKLSKNIQKLFCKGDSQQSRFDAILDLFEKLSTTDTPKEKKLLRREINSQMEELLTRRQEKK